MQPIPPIIADFLHRQHVMSLACQADGELWCANCFYCFDPDNARLIVLTKSSSKHGKLMQQNPKVVGTIAYQTENIRHIEGVQFEAVATPLTAHEKAEAQTRYFAKFPVAKTMPSEVWQLRLIALKHTCNHTAFAQKTHWQSTLQNNAHI